MTKLKAAARQALEALEKTHYRIIDAGLLDQQLLNENFTATTNLREALAAQQAAQPNAVLVEGFGRVALRKLNDLHEKGYAINGVSIATISEAGETNRGAVTTGGMVLWWPQQPAQQAAEPVARRPQDIIDAITAYGDARADQDAINAPTTSHERLADCIRLVRGVLTKQMAPTQQPLTEAFIEKVMRSKFPHMDSRCDAWKSHVKECRFWLSAAHGIAGSKT